MSNSNYNLKNFAIKLSAKIQECIENTTYINLPLRASDLAHNHSISMLVKEYGYRSLNQCLHLIVDHKMDDLLKGFSYERKLVGGQVKFEWFFSKLSSSPKAAKSHVRSLKIDINKVNNLFFSESEMEVLAKYSGKFEDLINGNTEPKTELQTRFKEIGISLLERRSEKISPIFFYEKIIAKYILLKHYITAKKENNE